MNVTSLLEYFLQPYCTVYVWRAMEKAVFFYFTGSWTYRMCKFQHFSKKVQYLTCFVWKERGWSVEARTRMRQVFDRYVIHCAVAVIRKFPFRFVWMQTLMQNGRWTNGERLKDGWRRTMSAPKTDDERTKNGQWTHEEQPMNTNSTFDEHKQNASLTNAKCNYWMQTIHFHLL